MYTTLNMLKLRKLCKPGFSRLIDNLGTINKIDKNERIPIGFILKSDAANEDLRWILNKAYYHDEADWTAVRPDIITALIIAESYGDHLYPHHLLSPIFRFLYMANPNQFTDLEAQVSENLTELEKVRPIIESFDGYAEALKAAEFIWSVYGCFAQASVFEETSSKIFFKKKKKSVNIPFAHSELAVKGYPERQKVVEPFGNRFPDGLYRIEGFRYQRDVMLPHYETFFKFIGRSSFIEQTFLNASRFVVHFDDSLSAIHTRLHNMLTLDISMHLNVTRALCIDVMLDVSENRKLDHESQLTRYAVGKVLSLLNLRVSKHDVWPNRWIKDVACTTFWQQFFSNVHVFENRLHQLVLPPLDVSLDELPNNKFVALSSGKYVIAVTDGRLALLLNKLLSVASKSLDLSGEKQIDKVLSDGLAAFSSIDSSSKADDANPTYSEFLESTGSSVDDDTDDIAVETVGPSDDDEDDEDDAGDEEEDDDDDPSTARIVRRVPSSRIRQVSINQSAA